jgi:hypothetical protein
MKAFRDLTEKDIECRINTASEYGCSLLLYKDARCDMRILDETVGPENWQRKHEIINGNLYCSVGIKCVDEWVWKQDVGTESYTEKEKGQASDAFKRACFNWGIGRELYTAPSIWIPKDKVTLKETTQNGKKKYTTYDKFRVTQIIIQNGEIKALAIKNDSLGKMAFTYDARES